MVFIIIFVVLVIAIGVVGGIFFYKQIQFRSTCKNCKQFYDYDRDIEWHETGRTNDGKTIKSQVAIKCTCDNCGAVKQFSKSMILRMVDNNGNVKDCNLEDQMRALFLTKEDVERILNKRAKKAEAEQSKATQQSETNVNTKEDQ
ncbi:MAG: hypothetical protein ACI4MQ_00595 [Candidatus Coproplasma sp.]